jgi:hypothetical protein
VKTFFHRSPREFWIFGQALGGLTVTRLALWMLSLAATRSLVRKLFFARHALRPERRCSEDQIIRAVVSAGKHSLVASTCLASSLVGQALLQRHGHSAQLRIGVRREAGGKFAAHAWLERSGKVILGGPSTLVSSYTRLPEMEHLIR